MILNEANSLAESILPYERDLFLFLNNSHNVFLDSFMWIYSSKFTWIPLAIVAMGILFYKTKWKYSILLILCITLLFVLCDQLSASVIKPFFERYRPTHHPDFERWVSTVNNYKGGRYGFVSAHAANGFGISMFVALLFRYRWLTITLFVWSSVTAYSRIYLGVHFISDIIGGMLLGLLIGYLIYQLFVYCRVHLFGEIREESKLSIYPIARARILCGTIFVLILSIIVISFINLIYNSHWFF